MKGRTKIVVVVITVVLVIVVGLRLGLTVFSEGGRKDFLGRKRGVLDLTVVATKVKVGDIERYISLAGEMRGIEEAYAFPDVPGKIHKILVEEGSYVVKNQHLMYIDRSQVGFSYNLSPVRAPISGRVGNISVSEGQFVSQTTPVATVVNDSTMEVVLLLPETFVGRVRKGDKAIIEVTPYPQEKFIGYVYSTDIVIDRGTRTLKVKVKVANPYRKLISGMYCNVRMLVEKVSNVTYVPNTSIREVDGEEVVYILTKTNLENVREDNFYYVTKRRVISGISDGKFTAVLQGVSEGDIVVSLGAEYLKDGVIVRVIEEEVE
ncbi:MAG: efflux RND transporter periplasmic adaptor subunit [Brevinematia bacterium]